MESGEGSGEGALGVGENMGDLRGEAGRIEGVPWRFFDLKVLGGVRLAD